MNIILLSVLVFNLVILINGQNLTKECNVGKNADTCMMHLLLVGDRKFTFPENQDQMSKHCRFI